MASKFEFGFLNLPHWPKWFLIPTEKYVPELFLWKYFKTHFLTSGSIAKMNFTPDYTEIQNWSKNELYSLKDLQLFGEKLFGTPSFEQKIL